MRVMTFLAGAAAGALASYYLDPQGGGRRRALVRDKMVHAGHEMKDLGEARARRAADRARGVMATGNFEGVTRTPPRNDDQLRDRIRSRMGRTISHPKAIEVEVKDGDVTLRGHIFGRELPLLMTEVESTLGVKSVRNELQAHDSADGIPELQGHAGERQREAAGQH